MKFSCSLKQLSNAINNVSLAINKKPNPIAVLDGVLIKCLNKKLTLIGFDMNLAIIKTIEVNSFEEGEIILNAQLLADILKKMESETITITCDENLKVKIENSETKFNISGLDAAQFPKIFTLEKNNKIEISNNDLKKLIFQTSFAISQNPSQNPILCGCLFKIEPNNLNLIALDGYRVAISKKTLKNCNLNAKFVISSKTLNELYKLLIDSENENVIIEFDSKYASFKINGYKILTRLLEGDYLDYESAIPKTSSTIVEINAKNLATRIERVAVMVTNRISVILKIEKETLELTCNSSLGAVVDVFNAKILGSKIEKIAFNFKYMLDALKHTQCDEIKIMFNDALSPIKIEPIEQNNEDSFLFLVLPVRI